MRRCLILLLSALAFHAAEANGKITVHPGDHVVSVTDPQPVQ